MKRKINSTIFAALFAMPFALWIALFAVVPPFDASAHSYDVGGLTIEHPWARSTAKSAKSGAVFMDIKNNGSAPDHLIAVKGDIAEKITLHRTLMEEGTMKMQKQDNIEIPGGGHASLQPGGYHIMLMGLKKPLSLDETFSLTLVFEKAGEVIVSIHVDKTGGASPMESMHHH